MGFLDGLMNVFKMSNEDYDEEDYDDEEYDDYDDEDDKQSKRKLFSGTKKGKVIDDEEEEEDAKGGKNASRKIIPVRALSPRGLEVVVIRTESMANASEITDTLLSGKAAILNLEGVPAELAQRVIDYSAGSCYAMRGNFQKVTNHIFLVTPPNVDISGDISEQLVSGGIDLSSFSKG